MIVIFGIFLLTLLVITALAIVRTDNLFVAVMLMGIASLLIAANFFLLDAADVALTEAAVGAGISTVLFLGALALTSERERAKKSNKLLSFTVVAAAALILIYATFDKPRFGDPEAPVQMHVAPDAVRPQAHGRIHQRRWQHQPPQPQRGCQRLGDRRATDHPFGVEGLQ